MLAIQHCPLCQSIKVQQIEGIETPLYYRCFVCKLIFIDDAFIPSPEAEKARYDQHHNSLENEGYVTMFRQFLQNSVFPYAKKGATTLDFGSGPVPVLQHLLEEYGYPTDIYDYYYAPHPVYDGKQYDLITSTETIEHIADAKGLWEFFVQHLREGGILSIMTLFYPPVEQFPKWWYRRDPTHIRFYQPDTFAWISENYPLSLVYIDGKNTVCYKKG